MISWDVAMTARLCAQLGVNMVGGSVNIKLKWLSTH